MENPYQSPPGEEPKPQAPLPNRLLTAGFAGSIFSLILLPLLLERPLPIAWLVLLLVLATGVLVAIVGVPELTDSGPRRSRLGQAVVSTSMLIDRGPRYQRAIREFREGKAIVHQGIIFQLAADNKQPLEWKAAIGIAQPTDELARRAEQYVAEIVGFLRDESPELFELTANRLLRVCFLENYEQPYHDIGMIFDGQLTWSLHGSEVAE